MVIFIVIIVPLIYAEIIFVHDKLTVKNKWKRFWFAIALFFPSWIILSVTGVLAADYIGFAADREGTLAIWFFLIACFFISLRMSRKIVREK